MDPAHLSVFSRRLSIRPRAEMRLADDLIRTHSHTGLGKVVVERPPRHAPTRRHPFIRRGPQCLTLMRALGLSRCRRCL